MRSLLAATLLFAFGFSSQAFVVISEVDLANNKLELVNTNSSSVNLTGYYLCNYITGTPRYVAITTNLVDLPNSTSSSLTLAAGAVMTLALSSTFVTDASGEIGLYINNSNYGSAANMMDYVSWGGDGFRDSVAATKGIWASGTFVNVSGITAGQTIQLSLGKAGNSLNDYSLAAGTLGTPQSVPEPSGMALAAIGALLTFALRRRKN